MSSLSSMIAVLSPMALYNLSATQTDYKELQAFACALDVFYSELDEIQREMFVATAVDYGIRNRERIYGCVRDDLNIDKRRQMITDRLSITTNDFTVDGFNKTLASLGIQYEIYESYSNNSIHVDCIGSFTSQQKEWITSEISKFVPAHLSVLVTFRVS
ncbi:MAG: DUF2313 domain-containing protein [Bacillota bacterium]|nr:DUF2313 domain-containing protein [Bacillota bacterium]